MLTYSSGTCDRCKTKFTGILQYMEFTCMECEREYTLCMICKGKQCLKCGGELETQQERLERQGINIMY